MTLSTIDNQEAGQRIGSLVKTVNVEVGARELTFSLSDAEAGTSLYPVSIGKLIGEGARPYLLPQSHQRLSVVNI